MKSISCSPFKLTSVMAAMLASFSASAALYRVIEVEPSTTLEYESVYGVAIQPSAAGEDCFQTECTDNQYALGGETRSLNAFAGQSLDGLDYREEVPNSADYGFNRIKTQDNFRYFCRSVYYYNTSVCDTWGDLNWGLWNKEIAGSTIPNAIAFVEGQGSIDESANVVINSLSSSAKPIGINVGLGQVSQYLRQTLTAIDENQTDLGALDSKIIQSRAWKTDGTYTVGSISRAATNNEGNFYSSKAAVWDANSELVELNWRSDSEIKNNTISQASLRDFVIKDGFFYGVGYNAVTHSNNNFAEASLYKVSVADGVFDKNKWTSSSIKNAEIRIDGDYIYRFSRLTGINENLIAIGEAKRWGASQGAYANRLFLVDVSKDTPSAQFLSGGIFFDGAGGKAGAINQFNEIVGQVDAETDREANAKPRMKRGFIYPLVRSDSDDDRLARFKQRAWWLDDLTNGENSNNAYRIIDAMDINDAGVISGTALKCEGGYDTTDHNSLCGAGSKRESVVAVKLVPIKDATAADIQPRAILENTVSRSGGSLGILSLGILAFWGWRRNS